MASAAHQADQYYYGVMQAVVVDNEDPLGEGRVRVTYPWLNQSMETEWCRVCQLYAGNGYGSFWVPEKKDEVLVACVHGDLNEAIVLGGLYNGKDKPAGKHEKAPGLDQKLFRTKAGHTITLDDTSGKEKITIVDKSTKNSIVIDTAANSITITAEDKLTITAKGKLSLTGKDVEIKANGGDVTVSGTSINLN